MELLEYCRYGDTYNAMRLIENPLTNIGYVHCLNGTALFWACVNKMTEVAYALSTIGDCNQDYVVANSTALLESCRNRMPDVALALIATNNSNPGYVDVYGNTALLLACRKRMNAVALALIATGQSNPMHIKFDDTAFQTACRNDMFDVVAELIKIDSDNLNELAKIKPEWCYNFFKTPIVDVTEIEI